MFLFVYSFLPLVFHFFGCSFLVLTKGERKSRALTLRLLLNPRLLLYKALNYFVLKTNKQKSDFQPGRIFNCFLITYEWTMGISLCKYLNRFSMMPYFHSAINVFRLLLLSSGFNFHGEDVLRMAKKETYVFFCCVKSGKVSEMRCSSEAVSTPLNTSECCILHFLCFPVGGSSEQEALTEGCHLVIIIYDPFPL